MTTAKDTTTPRPAIPHDPLPQAGQSLNERKYDIVFDKLLYWPIVAVATVVYTAMEWWRYLANIPPTLSAAIISTLLTLIITTFAILKFRPAWRELKSVKLGLRGEQHIGRYLDDTCRPLGYRVFHDIPCTSNTGNDNFNIDHALIGPAGIFVIETKNWTKPPQGTKAEIIYTRTADTETLTKPDQSFDTHAIAQARANADYLRTRLAQLTARDPKSISTKPVLLLPGWWITNKSTTQNLWILSDNTLHRFLPKEPQQFAAEDIALFSEMLAILVRQSQD